MTPELRILTRAHDYVAAGWCQGEFARDAEGSWVSSFDPKACSFCIMGAIDRAQHDLSLDRDAVYSAEAYLRAHIPGRWFKSYNDAPDRTKEQVVAVFSAAITDARRTAP